MKQRFAWLIKLYLALLAIFVTQKAAFMWIDKPAGAYYSVADCISVMAHGLLLDIPVTGYLIALPLLAAIASVWIARRIRLRAVATAYYVVVALCASVMFVADLSLYPSGSLSSTPPYSITPTRRKTPWPASRQATWPCAWR